MAKLTKQNLETFTRAASNWPTELAPEVLQAAIKAAEDANSAYIDAADAAGDAVFDEPNAQAQWDAEAESNVRAGKPLPSRDPVDIARIKVKTSAEDGITAMRALDGATYALGQILNDDAVLTQWIEAIEAKAQGLQTQLHAQVAKVEPVVSQLGLMLGLVRYLHDIPGVGYPQSLGTGAVAELRALASTPAWTPKPTQQNITV